MIKILPGMKLRVEDKPTFKVQSFVTLSSYLLRYDNVVTDESYAEALERNKGKAVWLSADAVVISARRLPQEPMVSVRYGDEVWVDEGRKEERGIWIVTKPGPMGGDDCRLIRKEK
jgi:hypothetical protein